MKLDNKDLSKNAIVKAVKMVQKHIRRYNAVKEAHKLRTNTKPY